MSLVLENVTKSFGGLRAVSGVGFSVDDRSIFGLIGPNGAGKTTLFNLITGVYRPDRGSLRLGDHDLASLRPAQIARAGIARTFQNVRLFAQLSVIENLLVACEPHKMARLAPAILQSSAHDGDEAASYERALEALRVFELQGVADAAPATLSYGNQRRLEIARALMLRPRVLLLDEPAAGMNTAEAEALQTQLRWLRDTFDVAIVLVEHNMQVVMGVCDRLHVLDHGETIAEGAPQAIRNDPKVIAAYLGEGDGGEGEGASPQRPILEPTVPGSLPRLAGRSLVDPSELSGARIQAIQVEPPPPAKLSEEALAVLSKDLMQNLEKGLSQPGLISAKPASTPTVVVALERIKDDDATIEATKEYPTKDEDETRLYVPAAKRQLGDRPSLDTSELEVTQKNPTADARHWAVEAAKVPLPASSEASSPKLQNVDSGWSDNAVAAAPVMPPSTPDVSKLDTGWSSSRLPAGPERKDGGD